MKTLGQKSPFALTLLLTSLGAIAGPSAHAASTPVAISLDNNQLPATDLVYTVPPAARKILSPEEAWRLKQSAGIDLSLLDPDNTSDLWKGSSTASDGTADQALPIQDGSETRFLGVIKTPIGRFKFNVQVHAPDGTERTLTLMISEDLHTTLLRKELLRRLGYRIPGMKHLPRVRIRFENALERDSFLRDLPHYTMAAASRWNVGSSEESGSDPLLLTFQDVVAMEATPLYYNLALGAPFERIGDTTDIRPEGPRILRSLAIPFSLAMIPESVNQADWAIGSIQSNSIVLKTSDVANFACTLDDALWMLRRMAKLTRADFTAIVDEAKFPEPVARLVTEKLIARRDSLVDLFSLDSPKIPFDSKVTEKPVLETGKLLQSSWPGYASRFSYGDPQSPLHGLPWYLLSEIESNAVSNLLAKANSYLPSKTVDKDYQQHAEELYDKGLARYIQTGQNQKVGIGLWALPLYNGGIDLSRDVVLGSYLGTNNLVQLADTFGVHVNAGIFVGADGFNPNLSIQGIIEGSLNLHVTHLKPLGSLKQAQTEPLKNEFVPWIFSHASGIFKDVADHRPGSADPVKPEELQKRLADDLDQLRKFIGEGESLILTESLSGTQGVSVSAQVATSLSPSATIQGGADELVVSRLHFFRKDSSTMLVFKDKGELTDLNLAFVVSLGAPAHFPILSVTGKRVSGTADTQIFTVNIETDPKLNPDPFTGANALAVALRKGSTELLEAMQKPTRIALKFKDSSSSLRFFHWVKRSLRTNGQVKVELPDGSHGAFISLTDGDQSGKHYQALATDVASYLVQRLTKSQNAGINTQSAPNPGQSFLGSSKTRAAEFQARVDSGVSQPFTRVQYRWEGWNISAKDLRKITDEMNSTYGFKLYADGFLGSTSNIKMYSVTLNIQLYEAALKHIAELKPADQALLERTYALQYRCFNLAAPEVPINAVGTDVSRCQALSQLQEAYAAYRKGEKDPSKSSQILFDIANNLERLVSFEDLCWILAGPDANPEGLFVYSTISGFREGAEDIMATLRSSTFGVADDANPNGVLSSVQQLLGIDSGEFEMQWIRDHL